MKLRRIRQLTINSYKFSVKWCSDHGGGSFSYGDMVIEIGTKDNDENQLLNIVCHELWELVAVEMHVRFRRPDCDSDYVFVYDHRQHDTMTNMFASLLSQFIT